MNRLSRLSLGQRVVLVIGLAAALVVIAGFITTAGAVTVTGWTGYAPLSVSNQPFLVPGGLPPYARLLVWLVVVVIRVAGSLPLMRSRPGTPADAPGRAAAKDAPGSPA